MNTGTKRLPKHAELAEVIDIQSHPRFRRAYPLETYTLQAARLFLGSGFFRKALSEWSTEELARTANDSETRMTDAFDAYHAILRYRLTKLNPIAPVIELNEVA